MSPPTPNRRTARTVLAGTLALLVALFAALLLLTPVDLRSAGLRAFIESRVGAAAGGRFTYEQLQLSIFPRPGLTLTRPALERADLAAAAEAATVVPKLWPLVRGEFQPAKIRLDAPALRLSGAVFDRPAPAAPVDFSRWSSAAAAVATERLPQVDIDIVGGRLLIPGSGELTLDVTGIRAGLRLSDGRLSAGLQCESNLWKKLELSGLLAIDSLKGVLELTLAEFRPAPLLAWGFPESAFQLSEGRVSLNLQVTSEGRHRAQARLTGDAAHLRVRHGGAEAEIDIDAIAAEMDAGPGRLSVSIPKLVARRPMAEASATLVYDEALAPRIAVGIEGQSVDVGEVRRTALALLSGSAEAHAVFDVLRGGSVPWIAVSLQADRLEELGRLRHVEIRGRMEQGRLFIPGVTLDLEGVSGDAVIADGVLEGSRLSAHTRGTKAQNGSLRLGLSGADPLFALDITMEADLQPLPEILERVVRNKAFLQELRRVGPFQGRARGRLELTGSLGDMQVKVDAADLDIRARHAAIPLPIAFEGGRFQYDEASLALEGVDVRLGRSRLPQMRAVLELTGSQRLRASSPSAELDLAELFPLAGGLGSPDRLRSIEGSVASGPWEFSGNPAAPESWALEGAGQVRNLTLASGRLPEAVRVESAAWSCRGKRLQAESRSIAMGSTRVHALAGELDWSEEPRLELSQGAVSIAVEHLYWLLDRQIGLQDAIGPLAPLAGALTFKELHGALSFPAAGAVQAHLSAALGEGVIRSERLPAPLAVDSGTILWSGSFLDIRHLDARIEESAAQGVSIGIDWGLRDSIAIRVESLLIECAETYPWLSRLPAAAWLRRDITDVQGTIALAGLRLSGNMRDPRRWSFGVEATLNHLDVATTFLENPVRIRDGRVLLQERATPAGEATAVRLDAFQVATGRNRALASGEIVWDADSVSVDLALICESIVWSELESLSDRFARRGPHAKRTVTGRIELRAEEVSLGRYHFQPVEAHVILRPQATRVEIERAGLCGIVTIGQLEFPAGQIEAFLIPIADNTLLDNTLTCLSGQKTIATGQFNIDGALQARSAPADFLKALSGKIEFISEEGRILRSALLARVLSLINITEIYRGTLPDLTGKGVEYKRTQISAEFANGEVLIHSWTLDGPSLWLGARGKINLLEDTLQLFVVVSPFKTFDRIIRAIPLIGYLFGGRLVAVPVQASGALEDPEVVPMHPAALGESILDMVGRALLLPVRIIQPLIPDIDASVDIGGSFMMRE
ncbi:MAG: AsmA-like C-terminal region-containing protein [Desulfobacterales bacterium]|jgi:hypothetical protein|nr:AsmA-like C-terminal region-containing protein [Desulfobacterales bacterium]